MVKARTGVKAAAVALVAGLAVTACSTAQLGAAAITGNSRISASNLTSQVTNLDAAYTADKAKGISPQRPVAQKTQQVLGWLILFRVYNEMAAQHHISVTPAQDDAARTMYTKQAQQSSVTLQQYWSAGAALPPDLLPELIQAGAIETAMTKKLNGGTAPTTSKQDSAVQASLSRQLCLAAKGLGINVNPQYGEYDYAGLSVVPAPSTLAADPTPSPAPSGVKLTPPC
jgi:peptidyl-prolyl cis-trans isomerase SurA